MIWGLGSGIWGLGSGVWDLGSEIWGLGLGVWDLVFGAQKLRTGVGEAVLRTGQLRKMLSRRRAQLFVPSLWVWVLGSESRVFACGVRDLGPESGRIITVSDTHVPEHEVK